MDTLASSLPGRSASKMRDALITRQSIPLRKKSFTRMMDPRVRPAGDGAAHVLLSFVTACVAPLEQASRHEHPRAAAAQRVSPERGGIARQHDERDEDVLGETAGAFIQA